MTVFVTKVWGFSEPCGPLRFSTAGWRERTRSQIQDGDLVVNVGTTKTPTNEEERGRVLGIMEPTRETVPSLDFDIKQDPHDFDEEGNYKWPFALINRRAWIIEERRFLNEISDRAFPMAAVLGTVPLTDEEAKAVLALRHREVPLLAPIQHRARVDGPEAARRRAAPPPTTIRSGVMHLRRAPAYTYCMEVEGAERSAFKIGWAFEYRARERQFNQSAMPDIGGVRYRTKLNQLWDSARAAFEMEQTLLHHFDDHRHPANREILFGVRFGEIEDAWLKFVSNRL